MPPHPKSHPAALSGLSLVRVGWEVTKAIPLVNGRALYFVCIVVRLFQAVHL